jgi:hypothetical protein
MINRPYPWSVVRTVKNHNVQPYYDKGSSVLVNVSTGSQLLLSRPAALAASTLHKRQQTTVRNDCLLCSMSGCRLRAVSHGFSRTYVNIAVLQYSCTSVVSCASHKSGIVRIRISVMTTRHNLCITQSWLAGQ